MSAPFTFQLINLGTGGIAPCAQCARSASTDRERGPRPAEEILAELERGLEAKDSTRDVAFGGFEPFAHPELPRLIAAVCDQTDRGGRGAGRLMLQTDGGALASGGNAQGAVLAGARAFELVYHSGDPDLDDELTGRPGLAQARQAGVFALRQVAAQQPDVRLTITGAAMLCRHAGRGAALAGIAQAALRDGLDALRICAEAGAEPDAAQVAGAAEILIPAGVWLFGDGCQSLLGGMAPYRVVGSRHFGGRDL